MKKINKNDFIIINNFIMNFKPGFVIKKKLVLKNFILLIFFFKYLKKKINNIKFFKASFFFITRKKKNMLSFLKAPNRHKVSQHQLHFCRYQIKWFFILANNFIFLNFDFFFLCNIIKKYLNIFFFFETTLCYLETRQIKFLTKFNIEL